MPIKHDRTHNGFRTIEFVSSVNAYGSLTIQQSSAVGDYDDSLDYPGSSFLWIGNDFDVGRAHCNRDDVQALVGILNNWLKTGELHED